MRDHPDGQVAKAGHDAFAPSGEVRVECLGLQAAECEGHDGLAVGSQVHRRGSWVHSGLGELLQLPDPVFGLGHGPAGLGHRSALSRAGVHPPDTGTVSLGLALPVFDVSRKVHADRPGLRRHHAAQVGSVRRSSSQRRTSYSW
jgi:hypothetical protein